MTPEERQKELDYLYKSVSDWEQDLQIEIKKRDEWAARGGEVAEGIFDHAQAEIDRLVSWIEEYHDRIEALESSEGR